MVEKGDEVFCLANKCLFALDRTGHVKIARLE